MNQKSIKILAIESSCDETAAAIIELRITNNELREIQILSNIVSSQVKLHAKYGGVYPELASREHIKNIIPVIEQALLNSNFKLPIFNQIHPFDKLRVKNSNVLKLNHLKFNKNLKFKIKNYIDYIAVTTGPGLIGSLLVGVETAKTLAYVFNKPIIPVNHLEGHVYANFVSSISNFQFLISNEIQNSKVSNIENYKFNKNLKFKIKNSTPKFPFLALVVSGGHTSLIYMKDHLDYKIIGETLDDAAGEAFDKVAKLLDLPYPGGPQVEIQAAKFSIFKSQFSNNFQNSNFQNPKKLIEARKLMKLKFPRPMIESKDFNFSFSGLKTAVLYAIKKLPKPLSFSVKSLICKEFQDAVVETLVVKTLRAAEKYQVKSILLGGGVAANSRLREEFELRITNYELCKKNSNSKTQNTKYKILNTKYQLRFFVPEKSLCTDNAAVIGTAAAYKIFAGKTSSWDKIKANANLEL